MPAIGTAAASASNQPAPAAPGRPAIDPALLVPLEQAWSFDLASLDLDADPIARVGGVAIAREDLRRWVVLTRGRAAVEARLLALAGERVAAAAGRRHGVDDALFEAWHAAWSRARGLDPEEGMQALAGPLGLPTELARRARRDGLEALLDYFPPGVAAADLPAPTRAALEAGGALTSVAPLLDLLARAVDPAQADPGRELAVVSEVLALHLQTAARADRALRSWSFLDGPLGAGAVAAFAMGEGGTDPAAPPWVAAGVAGEVATAPIWELLAPALPRAELVAALRELVWSRVLRARLAADGALPSDERAWADYAAAWRAGSGALFGLEAEAQLFEGFPTLAQYREAERLFAGWLASRPADWESPAELAAFAERNSAVAEGWVPALEILMEAGSAGAVPAETRWSRLLDAVSLSENALARLAPGETGPVWSTRVGPARVRLVDRGRPDAAPPAEAARERRRELLFRLWIHQALGSATLER